MLPFLLLSLPALAGPNADDPALSRVRGRLAQTDCILSKLNMVLGQLAIADNSERAKKRALL